MAAHSRPLQSWLQSTWPFHRRQKQKSPCVSTWRALNCKLWLKSLMSTHVELINLRMQMERPVTQNQSTGNVCREAAQVVWQKVINEIWIGIVAENQLSLQTFFYFIFLIRVFFLFFQSFTATTKELNSCLVHLHSQSKWKTTQTALVKK